METYALRLLWKARTELSTDRSLNVEDDAILRETLEELVAERMGPRHRENLTEWSLRVLNPKTHRVIARVRVDDAGRTQVNP